jgi:predicted transglutaminase-like cysteine proteinase
MSRRGWRRWIPSCRRVGVALVGATALVVVQSALCPVAAARGAESEGFGTDEIFSADLLPFARWTNVVRRTALQDVEQQRLCGLDAADPACVLPRWEALVAELRKLPMRERITRANKVLNRQPYVLAGTNWHDPTHWETPFEFLAKGGQCEDYAIAKFMALAASGVSGNDMRIAVVRDKISGLDHAITIVLLDGEALVLDNQTTDVEPAALVHRYAPYYSINLTGWWYR